MQSKGYAYNGQWWEPTGKSTFLGPEYKSIRTGETRVGRPPIVVNPKHDKRSIKEFYDPDRDDR